MKICIAKNAIAAVTACIARSGRTLSQIEPMRFATVAPLVPKHMSRRNDIPFILDRWLPDATNGNVR